MSSNFRNKRKQKVETNIKNTSTLENKHLSNLKKMELHKNNLQKYQKELIKINKELEKLEEQRTNAIIIDLGKRAELLNRKDFLENEINNIEHNNDEINYFDLTSDLLIKYYEKRTDIVKEPSEKINILSLFSSKKTITKVDNDTKSELFTEYCQRVEGIRIKKEDGSNRIKYCNDCKIEKILNPGNSSYVCPECGHMEFVIMDDDIVIKEYSPYERVNHLKDWLKQLQAKESIDISEEIYNQILKELNKNPYYRDTNNITRTIIQKILKKIGHTKLYKHIPLIQYKITGKNAIMFNNEQTDKIIKMFLEIQEPWELYKPRNRKSFISYPYFINKACQLLEIDNIKLPLLDFDNLIELDKSWKKICQHLKWQYISSE